MNACKYKPVRLICLLEQILYAQGLIDTFWANHFGNN